MNSPYTVNLHINSIVLKHTIMLFTIYGDLKEIHAYKGKTLIAERSANMKNCIF